MVDFNSICLGAFNLFIEFKFRSYLHLVSLSVSFGWDFEFTFI